MMWLGMDSVGLSGKFLDAGHGIIKPSEDVRSYTLDVGREFTFFVIELKNIELIPNKRNFGYIIAECTGDNITKWWYGTSNATGTSWGSVAGWYKSGSNNPFTKNGTVLDIDLTKLPSGTTFFADTEYEWSCI